MLTKPARQSISAALARKINNFRSEEDGAMAIFALFVFVLMLLFGGIAVDVMRFEMRRVALQETMDRATLAASNVVIPPSQTPQSIATEWFNKAGLGDGLTFDYTVQAVTGEATTTSRRTTMNAKVRSYNWFMHMLDVPYFESPAVSSAQQGESKIEVIMVLDITGSMAESSGSTTKIAALRQAASNFATILKFSKDTSGNYTIDKDPNDLISIGMVPYSSNVNIPVNLRNQYTVTNLSTWGFVANAGVPNINCFEIDPGTFNTMALDRTTPIRMAAVAQTGNPLSSPGTGNTPPSGTNFVAVTSSTSGGRMSISYSAPIATDTNNSANNQFGPFMCNHGDNPNTGANEAASNLVMLPSTDITALKTQIASLNARGNTSIAVGMRWGTALIDESARPIYTALRGGVPGMAGRPADNADTEGVTHSDGSKGTRKIIVLMTDGTHVASRHIRDAYKSGPSPIWRGTSDGRLAIRFTSTGSYFTSGTRPGISATNTCSGWQLATNREFFVPHLKASSVRQRSNASQTEGNGGGTNTTGACDPLAWLAPGSSGAPSWTGSGTVRQLDWSEVWRYASVDWVIEQLYMRSNVVGATTYSTIQNAMVGNYLTSEANMDALLNQNCNAAKGENVEIFGIVLGDDVTEAPVRNCSSSGTGYYYKVTNANDLTSAFEEIAKIISPLRLTE